MRGIYIKIPNLNVYENRNIGKKMSGEQLMTYLKS